MIMNNKIYTYYEDVNFNLQNDLLEIWEKSWRKYGFDTIILSRKDAQQSVLYQKYYDFVQRIHEQACGKQLKDKSYWIAAQLEIVAFHTIVEPSYISDYDMINNGFHVGENLESLVHWRNDACSCFASGDKVGWERYINFLFEKELTIIEWCKKESANTGRSEFGDQDFLIAVRDEGIKNNIYKMYRNLDVAGLGYFINETNNCTVIHVSHENVGKIQKTNIEYQEYTQDQIRLIIANKILEGSK